MKQFALENRQNQRDLFIATASKMKINADAVEKDFWICYMIDHLFNESAFKDMFVFKGGTSLSKSYHVIERFSEDIDMVLDWTGISDESNPWDERSNTKQDKYNKEMNAKAAEFYRETLVPSLNEELSNKLGAGTWVRVDSDDEMIINFYYPHLFEADYILPVIRLEIGPLSEWTPSHITDITPFVADYYPDIFKQKSTKALTVDAERTFWEKITILHTLAYYPDDKTVPARYARHLYDVYCMGNSVIKEKAFAKKELLERDVEFKLKFYYSKRAHYESATLEDVKLVPRDEIIKPLREDYQLMSNMIYGDIPDFDGILSYLGKLEKEIHELI